MPHIDIVDKMFEVRGIGYIVRLITTLAEECKKYHDKLKGE